MSAAAGATGSFRADPLPMAHTRGDQRPCLSNGGVLDSHGSAERPSWEMLLLRRWLASLILHCTMCALVSSVPTFHAQAQRASAARAIELLQT